MEKNTLSKKYQNNSTKEIDVLQVDDNFNIIATYPVYLWKIQFGYWNKYSKLLQKLLITNTESKENV